MSMVIIIVTVVFLVILAGITWVAYKYSVRKKKDQVTIGNIDKKIASSNLEEVSLKALEKPKESLGKLIYAIKYAPLSKSLMISVKSGHDLIAINTGGSSDPYVKVWLKDSPNIKFETKVKRRTLNPVYNEEFQFLVEPEEVVNKTVILFVYDFDRFSKHEPMGCLMIDLGTLDLSKMIEDWAELDPPNHDINNEIPLGDICISLKYDPDQSKLYVIILEGKELKKHAEEDLYDPYLKLSLEDAGVVLKKKVTSIKKATPNPYYNEEFVFSLSQDILSKVILVITVFNCSSQSKKGLPIGNIMLGGSITGSGLKHWKEIIANPKRVVAHWHSLIEVVDSKR